MPCAKRVTFNSFIISNLLAMTWLVVCPSTVVLNAKITSSVLLLLILLINLSIDNSSVPILFKADKPYANFVNQNYPPTASIFSDDVISERV